MIEAVAGGVAAGAGDLVAPAGDLLRGAVAGAFVVALAFLAGFAALRRSAPAVSAFVMIGLAALMQARALGLVEFAAPRLSLLFQGLFAASVIVFIASAVRAARGNAVIGGFLFFAAIGYVAFGVAGLFASVDFANPMRLALYTGGSLIGLIVLVEAARGDLGAQLILPGAFVAAASPFAASVFGMATPFAAPAMFSIGVIASALIALTEFGSAPTASESRPASLPTSSAPVRPAPDRPEPARGSMLVAETKLAEILDYAGLAVFDWTPRRSRRTDALGRLFGGASGLDADPARLRDAVHAEDADRFDAAVFGEADAPFDLRVRLRDGRIARLRGARAAGDAGELERLVLFAEEVEDAPPTFWHAAPTGPRRRRTDPPVADADIAGALEAGSLRAAFQPIVSLSTEKVVGYEALLRAGAGAGVRFGQLSTEEIVIAAERQGRGADLAALMLASSAEFLADRLAAQPDGGIFVAFNVSFAQMQAEGFVDAVARAVEYFDLPARALVCELTETDAVTDEAAARTIFARLREAGAGLAFDDFGAGYSSLSNLHKFSFDFLKIDKSFVERLDKDDPDASKIVAALAGLGDQMGLTVIAEGLATRTLADAARRHGCALGQGFAFGEAEFFDPPAVAGDVPDRTPSVNGAPEVGVADFAAGDTPPLAGGAFKPRELR